MLPAKRLSERLYTVESLQTLVPINLLNKRKNCSIVDLTDKPAGSIELRLEANVCAECGDLDFLFGPTTSVLSIKFA